MKRLLIRSAALLSVVGLGALGITQAQRGLNRPAADRPATAENPGEPGMLPTDPGARPLSGATDSPARGRRASWSEATAVRPASAPALASADGAAEVEVVEPPERVPAGALDSRDPFHVAGPMNRFSAELGDRAPAEAASALPAERSAGGPTPTASDSRYPELANPATMGATNRLAAPGGLSEPGFSSRGAAAPMPDQRAVGSPEAAMGNRSMTPEPRADLGGPAPRSALGRDERWPLASPPAQGEPGRIDADPAALPATAAPGYVGASRSWPSTAAEVPVARQPMGPGAPLAEDTGLPDTGTALGTPPAPGSPGAAGDAAFEGTGRPGPAQLEGPRTPQVTIQKTAPPQVQVGKPAKFVILVRNSGSVPASAVEVRDEVPRGMRLLGSNPRASRGVRGELVWALGAMQPTEERTIEVELMPMAEGELGSVATVTFAADASARSVATKPALVVETSAPGQVLVGDELTLSITVTNPGSGTATGVILEEHVPAGLQHPAGAELEYEVGELPPGESRRLELTLLAVRPGKVTNLLVGRAEASLRAEDRLEIEVTSPQLEVRVEGPRRRYLEREANYQLVLSNPGTAPARQVDLIAYLPPGWRFLGANNAGSYDESQRAVHWRLEELPVAETGVVELAAMPIEPGQQSLRVRATAERGATAEVEQPVVVEGIAAIHFQAADVVDPVEVGGETTYEIRVVNQGSKASNNVRVAVLFPPEIKPVAAEGPAQYAVEPGRVLFDALPRLAPKADTTYRVRAEGVRPGDARVQVQLTTDEMQAPVSKEESTRVYADE